MQELSREGVAKAIGVSNFFPDRLVDLIDHSEVRPAVNKIETHPYNQRRAGRSTASMGSTPAGRCSSTTRTRKWSVG